MKELVLIGLPFNKKPQKIISLVPSITELLFDLGLDNDVTGITKFCVHPQQWFKTKTRIGGTKNIQIDKIKSLHPDLIIANKEENVKEQIEALQKTSTVWLTDITTFEDSLQMITNCGVVTGKKEKAIVIVEKIKSSFNNLQKIKPEIKTLYLIWQNPYMSIGSDTFIHDMMHTAGFNNVCKDHLRYPTFTLQQIIDLNPELILLSSEPFPFKQKHIEELQQHLPNTKILLVDGEMFSWYGSRMIYAADYFKNLKIADV